MIGYGRQDISDEDIRAVEQVLRSDWLTQGPMVEAFEKKLTEVTGSRHAVVCSSGTAALHLAAMAGGLATGKSAIVPAVTFVATASAVRMTGAEVVFADVDPMTGRITPETLSAALSNTGAASVSAVLPVHLGGSATSMPEICSIASAHDAIVIEDACHALGGGYERDGEVVPVGACTDSQMACFSFHPVKPVTTGEGGAVTTNDAGVAAHLRRLCSHGITRQSGEFKFGDRASDSENNLNPWYYEMQEIGWNYRLSDIHSALGLSQLNRLNKFRRHRCRLAALYRELLSPLAPIVQTPPPASGVTSGHHLFTVLIDFEAAGLTRAGVMAALRDKGIGTQVHYIPVPWHPYYEARYGRKTYPGADAYYGRCLTLPLFAGLSETDVSRVVENLAGILKPG